MSATPRHSDGTRKPSLRRDTAGAVTIEYVVVFAFVGLTTVAAVSAAVPAIARHYAAQRAVLYQPYP